MKMAVSIEKNCGICKHYKDGDGYNDGECRRYPPQFAGVKDVVTGYNSDNLRDYTEERTTWGFPEVSKRDCCGEFDPKEIKPINERGGKHE